MSARLGMVFRPVSPLHELCGRLALWSPLSLWSRLSLASPSPLGPTHTDGFSVLFG